MKYLGFDTETIGGTARLIGLSDGTHIKVRSRKAVLDFFGQHRNGAWLFGFNADYDVQALIKWLTPSKARLRTLMRGLPWTYAGITFKYIPHKFLQFDKGYIFDIRQFYGGSLQQTAMKYLGRGKLDVDAKKITERNIYSDRTIEYCINDAVLAYELAMYLQNSLPDSLRNVRPISNAYLASQYFRPEIRASKLDPWLNRYFRLGYRGGRFEVIQKGSWLGQKIYAYDINSAYPYELANLRTTFGHQIVRYPEYLREASYSVMEVECDIPPMPISPVTMKAGQLVIYPVGHFRGIVTKGEYERILQYHPKVHSAIHLFCSPEYPFREKVQSLYQLKLTAPNPLPYKIVMNSLYGKLGASTEKFTRFPHEQTLDVYWHPQQKCWYTKCEDIMNSNFVFASEITARTRLRMYDVASRHSDTVIALATDSVLSTAPLPLPLSSALGDWKLDILEDVVLIGSGVYFYRKDGELCGKYRGFPFQQGRVQQILDAIGKARSSRVSFRTLKRYSIQECLRLDAMEMANAILDVTRKLDLNFDQKRIWADRWRKGSEVFTKRISSEPIFLVKIS